MYKDHQQENHFLESFDHIQRAKSPDFFQTRLMARMEKELVKRPAIGWMLILKPVPALTLLACLVIMNFYTLGDVFFHKSKPAQQEEVSMSRFMTEYNLNSSVDSNQ